MAWTRRTFLQTSAAGLAGALAARELLGADADGTIRVSARHFGSNLAEAKKAGLDGVEVGVGGPADTLHIANADYRKKIKDQMAATGLAVSSLSMDLLNGHPVHADPRGEAWLVQTIEAAADLGAAGILVPFFGKAGLLEGRELKQDDVAALAAVMKKVAPKAKAAGVVLGLENTCSGKQNLEILGRIESDAVACYYDIGNSTYRGYDVPAEIRALKGHLCPCLHFKDGGHYLGEGRVKMEPVGAALEDVGYSGWIVLETACPSKDRTADCKRNADFVRKLLGIQA
jgi:sugar phosphate isomerase/epimerase